MVSVYFGMDYNAVLDIDTYFRNVYDANWFDDDIVKRIVKDIDGSTVLSKNCIQSEILGQIPPEFISGGAKACILLLKYDEALIDLIACGDNCEEWLSRIFCMKDVKVTMSGCDLTFRGYDIKGICENDNSIINNAEDWVDKMCEMAGDPKNER